MDPKTVREKELEAEVARLREKAGHVPGKTYKKGESIRS